MTDSTIKSNRLMWAGALCACSVLAMTLISADAGAIADEGGAAGSNPISTAFTYQGELNELGGAASGPVDMVFELFGQFDGGTPLATLVANGVELDANGRFSIDLDFGNHYNGQERWLQITVEGETLSPRQPLMAAPYAMYALNGGGGGVGGWIDKGALTHIMDDVGIGTTAPEAPLHVMDGSAGAVTAHNESVAVLERAGDAFLSILTPNNNERGLLFGDPENFVNGGIVYNSPSIPDGLNFRTGGNLVRMSIANNGFVGIGRTGQVSGAEVFGLYKDTSSYGGMYIQTSSQSGLPFYGYSSGGDIDAYHYFDGASGKWHYVNSAGVPLTITNSGDVGIGTTSPGGRLNVSRDDSGTVLRVTGPGSAGTGALVTGVNIGVQVSTSTTGTALQVSSVNGSARAASFYGNTTSPLATVWNDGSGGAMLLRGTGDASATGNGLLVIGDPGATNTVYDANEIIARNNGAFTTLHLNAEGGNVAVGQNSGGTTRLTVPVIQITGGSDLSEQFDVATVNDVAPLPGMVVCIDPRHPGKLIPSTKAYDRTVAGVISGANGVKTGMMMGQSETLADGAHAVALTGRVYVMVDAGDEAIQPGDLLTTSDVAGHAMKVSDHGAAQGAILGKAMTRLEAGERGMVLVLVSLQ